MGPNRMLVFITTILLANVSSCLARVLDADHPLYSLDTKLVGVQKKNAQRQDYYHQNATMVGQIPISSATDYVNIGGSDTLGDGSITNPYRTVEYAQSTIMDAASLKHYSILLGAGRFVESSLLLKPWVWIIGQGRPVTYLAVSSGAIGLDPSFEFGGNRAGLLHLYLNAGTGLMWNLSAIGGDPTPSAVLSLDNVWIAGDASLIGRPQGIDFLEAYDCFWFTSVTMDSMLVQMQGMQFQGNLVLTDTQAPCQGTVTGSLIQGMLITNGTSPSNGVNWQLQSAAAGGWSLVGATTLIADSSSWPLAALITQDMTSFVARSSDAFGVAYTPDDPSNWETPVPVTVQDALDRLAALP